MVKSSRASVRTPEQNGSGLERPEHWPKRDHCRLVWPVGTMLVLLLLGGDAFAQTPTVPAPGDLKKLSLDELQQIEVTSVSKRPERLSAVASAIQVVTADDIRRAGATTLPEALRLA